MKLAAPLSLKTGSEITFASSDVDLCCEMAVVTSSPGFAPTVADPRDAAVPAMPQGFSAQTLGEGRVKLSWQPSSDADFHHFSIYVGHTRDFAIGNTSIIRSLYDTEIIDRLPEGKTQAFYKLVTVDHRWHTSEAAVVEVDLK
jgi:hypothetical protein